MAKITAQVFDINGLAALRVVTKRFLHKPIEKMWYYVEQNCWMDIEGNIADTEYRIELTDMWRVENKKANLLKKLHERIPAHLNPTSTQFDPLKKEDE